MPLEIVVIVFGVLRLVLAQSFLELDEFPALGLHHNLHLLELQTQVN